MEIVEHERRAYLRTEARHPLLEDRLGLHSFVASRARADQEPGTDDPSELLAPEVGDRHVHRDSVQPRSRRPGPAVLVAGPGGPYERLLAQVLGQAGVEDHRPDRAVDRSVLALVELLELGRRVELG